MSLKLLSVGNPKTLKGMKEGFNTYILHLAPASLSGHNTCPKATEGCKAACLNTAGRGGMFKKGENTNIIQQARIRKTKMFYENREEFFNLLVKDITLAIKQSEKKGLIPVFRLNGTSDISFEKYGFTIQYDDYSIEYKNIFERFPNVQFYDYTKVLGRKVNDIKNYSLTFSAADGNDNDVAKAINQGYNIAMVFALKKTQPMPEMQIVSYTGGSKILPVYNGDESDLRFLDPKGVIVGLYAKGKAKKDTSGFVKYPTVMLKMAA
jgi:hypothetical protein